MPLVALFTAMRSHGRDHRNEYQANNEKLLGRLQDIFCRTWDLGFTAFGGPPVHFRIFYRRFVEGQGKLPWIDDQTYQELFAICQALPGPGSTKMAFCIGLIHAGFLPALFFFLIWSLPGALGMYGLSLGVQRINEVLPDIVYALLSGLNASTVGIIALAAVNLADKAITDRLTRILVVIGGSAGLCYNALWYFPILMVIGGSTTVFWDLFGRQKVGKIKTKLSRRRLDPQRVAEESNAQASIPLEQTGTAEGVQKRAVSSQNRNNSTDTPTPTPTDPDNRFEYNDAREQVQTPSIETRSHAIPVRWGISIIIIFFASFIAILVTRGTLNHPPLELKLFANMYLAGTIIFGGGPVVIPLLREYVVEPGWVSSRDFLIGLAIIQAFPGPNFNFAVYLGALALASSSQPTVLGAFLGFVGIFLPGITLALGVQSLWRVFRTNPYIVSLLRGINATAVGLVFTAVYRLWEIGYLTSTTNSGQSLGNEPFWLLIAAVTYAANAWFGVPPAVAIVSGGILGLCWYGAVGR